MRLLINPDLQRPIRPEAFSVGEINSAIASGVASIVAATGVEYQQFNAIPLLMNEEEFFADTYRTRIAITNIVKNACLHSKGTHVWMISQLHIQDQSHHFLDWTVVDNGTGIPESEVDRLFRAGQRGDSEADGTGLGLHIAKTWIEEIGGAVLYSPRKLGGSEFTVRIPIEPAERSSPVEDEPAELNTPVQDLLPHLKVLMAEDEATLRMLGQKILNQLVAGVVTAENGSVALEKFDSSFNLILTDYFMPQMSGVEFAARLREQGYTGVILGITAATIGDQREEMLRVGVDMVLPKPLNAETFKNAVSDLIEQGRFDDLIKEVQV